MPNPANGSTASESHNERDSAKPMSAAPEQGRRQGDPTAQPQHGSAHRQSDSAGQRAHPRGRHEKPERVRPAVQDPRRENRHQHGIRHPHQAHRPSISKIERMAFDRRTYCHPSVNSCQARRRRGGGRPRGDAHRQQRSDHRHVANPSIRKHQPSPTAAMTIPAMAGPIEARRVHHRRVQRNGIPEVLAASTICTTNACRAGMSKALIIPWKSASATMCQTWMVPLSARAASAKDCSHGEHLRHDQRAVAVPAVHPNSRRRRQEEGGICPQILPRPAAPPTRSAGIPASRGDSRHPGANQRNGLPAEEQPVVPRTQSAQRKLEVHIAIFPSVPAGFASNAAWICNWKVSPHS